MAIDPMLYEKLSGRKGDPRDRQGQFLASEVKSKQSRREAREMGFLPLTSGYYKAKAIFGIVGALSILVFLLVARSCG